jgi:hypothetical protein
MRYQVYFILLLLTVSAQAQIRKYSNEFLNIGVGGRALGLAGANIAGVNDLTAGYWNPAGLSKLNSSVQASFMHAQYFAGIANYDYGAFAARIDEKSGFSVSIIRLAVDNIPNTLNLIDANGNINYDRVTTFSSADYGFLVSYGRNLSSIEGLNVGGTAKIIRRTVGDFAKSIGFGVDAGATLKRNKWRHALVLRDVFTTFNAWQMNFTPEEQAVLTKTGNELPQNSIELTAPRLIIGSQYKFDFLQKFSLAGEINLINSFDRMRNTLISSNLINIDPALGLELGFKEIVFVRGGLGNFQKRKELREFDKVIFQPNIGIGLQLKNFTIDYALTDIGDQVALYSHVISLKIGLNPKNR